MQLELRGVPCVTITSSIFRPLAEREAEAFGLADLPIVEVEHPVATKSEAALRDAGRALSPVVLEALTAPTGG